MPGCTCSEKLHNYTSVVQLNDQYIFPSYLLAVVIDFSLLRFLDDATVAAVWEPVETPYLSHYTVYYKPDKSVTEMSKSQTSKEELIAVFPAGSASGVIGELEEGEKYLFSISVSYSIHEKLYKGNKSNYTEPTIGRGTMLVSTSTHICISNKVCFLFQHQPALHVYRILHLHLQPIKSLLLP